MFFPGRFARFALFAVSTFLCALTCCSGIAQEHFALSRCYQERPAGESRPVLVRELFRQALLIAAREELGITTHDALMASPREPSEGRVIAHPHFVVSPDGKEGYFEVYTGDAKEPVWRIAPGGPYTDFDVGVISKDMQMYSRTEFPEILAKIGLQNKNPLTSSMDSEKARSRRTEVDAERLAVARKLHEDLDLLQQCLAIQHLHQLIREHGSHVELLGMLARSYGNLCQLSRRLMDGMPEALAARAMLYGDRVVDLFPEENIAHWSRGYAHALAGSLVTAEAELEMDQDQQPNWARIARHIVWFESEELDQWLENPKSTDKKIAALGYLLVTEVCPLSQYRLGSAQKVAAELPESPRVLLGIYHESGPGLATQTISHAVSSWKNTVNRFKSEPSLTPLVRSSKSYRQFIQRLEQSESSASDEFPNSAMARIIDDTAFWLQVWEVSHQTVAIGLDSSDLVDECRSTFVKHRHWPIMELVRDTKQAKEGAFSEQYFERVSKVAVLDATPWGTLFISWYDKEPLASSPNALTFVGVWERGSANTWEYLRYLRLNSGRLRGEDWSKNLTDVTTKIAPHSPEAHAFWLREHWQTDKGRANELRSRFKDHLIINWAIGVKCFDDKRYDLSIAALERVLEKTSDVTLFNRIALMYKEQGDLDKWAETLERFLDFESVDLTGADVMKVLAYHYLNTKDDPLTALKFARGAARSGAEWGLRCLIDVYSALEEWEDAEPILKSIGERYGEPHIWYMWCLHYGHGNIKAAKQRALEYERECREQSTKENINARLFILKMSGGAIDEKLRQDALAFSDSALEPLLVLLQYWEENKIEDRDRAAKKIASELNRYDEIAQKRASINFVARILVEMLEKNATADEHVESFQKHIDEYPQSSTVGYIAGRALELLGQKDKAIPFYEHSTRVCDYAKVTGALARLRLQELKP